ncbi:hypothetical protein FOXB_02364, partial [Fusarium oxysporum f. sp. conglutinans Fo5176]
NNQSDQLY